MLEAPPRQSSLLSEIDVLTNVVNAFSCIRQPPLTLQSDLCRLWSSLLPRAHPRGQPSDQQPRQLQQAPSSSWTASSAVPGMMSAPLPLLRLTPACRSLISHLVAGMVLAVLSDTGRGKSFGCSCSWAKSMQGLAVMCFKTFTVRISQPFPVENGNLSHKSAVSTKLLEQVRLTNQPCHGQAAFQARLG